MRTIVISQDKSGGDIVSVESAKEHSRITDTFDDGLIAEYVESATDMVQQWLNRKLYPTTIAMSLDAAPTRVLLPYPPVARVDSIVAMYNDEEVTLTKDVDWKFNAIAGRVTFIGSQLYLSSLSDLVITYTAGYATPADVPAAIKHAIKMTFATMYENREDVIVGTSVMPVPLKARRILATHRVGS